MGWILHWGRPERLQQRSRVVATSHRRWSVGAIERQRVTALQTLNVRRAFHSAALNLLVSAFWGSASVSPSAAATAGAGVVSGGTLGATSWSWSVSGANSRRECQCSSRTWQWMVSPLGASVLGGVLMVLGYPKPRGCSNVAMAPLNQSGCLRRQSFEGTATSVCCITPSSSPASGEKRIMNKGKRVFKRMFRRGVDKEVRMPLSLVRSNSHMFSPEEKPQRIHSNRSRRWT